MEPCNREEQVLLYHYGELSRAESAACELHVKECARCRQSLAVLAAAGAALAERKVSAPDALVAAVRGRVVPAGRWGWFKTHRWFRYSTAAASLAAGLIVFSGVDLGDRAAVAPRPEVSASAVSASAFSWPDALMSGARSANGETALAGYDAEYVAYLEKNDSDGFLSSVEAVYYGSSDTDDVNRLLNDIDSVRAELETERTKK